MTVAINMWMYGYGVGIAHKGNNGRVKGVVGIELETKAEGFIMIKRSWTVVPLSQYSKWSTLMPTRDGDSLRVFSSFCSLLYQA